ncbi:MAG TPA: MFS transporter [Sphingomonas sp.]|nr:MFS transporter [Sphingomonas sp.]
MEGHLAALAGYLLTLFSMATIGAIAPLVGKLAIAANASTAQVGFGIALYSVPSALLSGLIGLLADKWGAIRILVGSSLLAAAATFYLNQATSLFELWLGLFGAGMGFCGVVVSAPALIIERLGGNPRARWLSLWSTYGPAGFAIGLLLTAPFAEGQYWRAGLLIDGLLLMAGAAVAMCVPSSADRSTGRAKASGQTFGAILALVHDARIIRLALAISLPTGISYGTSLLMPSYLANVYGVTIATASGVVALAKLIIVMAGGLISGWLLARRVSAKPLFLALALTGFIAQLILYFPGSGFAPAVAALAVWLFTYAAMCGIAMALLPSLLGDEATSGAASGLVSQAISCTSFLGSVVYFSGASWPVFVVIAAIGLTIAFAFLPGGAGKERTVKTGHIVSTTIKRA